MKFAVVLVSDDTSEFPEPLRATVEGMLAGGTVPPAEGTTVVGSPEAEGAAAMTPDERRSYMARKTDNLIGRLGTELHGVVTEMARQAEGGQSPTVPSLANALGVPEAVMRRWVSVLRRSLNATDRWWGGPPMLVDAPFTGGHVHYELDPDVRARILQNPTTP